MTKTNALNKNKESFQRLIQHVLSDKEVPVNVPRLPHAAQDEAALLAAFLYVLSGEKSPQYRLALNLLREGGAAGGFLLKAARITEEEITAKAQKDEVFAHWLEEAAQHFPQKDQQGKLNVLRRLFFPEGLGLDAPQMRRTKVEELRLRRAVTLTRLNAHPIRNPLREVLFTSNLLLTTPLNTGVEDPLLTQDLRLKLEEVAAEEQKFWYDHPIPLGIAPHKNEALYGLRALDEAVAFEKKQGLAQRDEILTVALSASVTHEGLQRLTKRYFRYLFKQYGTFANLRLFIFTEEDTQRMLEEALLPLATHFGLGDCGDGLRRVFGVDGEYGRHYSFLKALAALWQVFEQPELRGTFKIDLDQVFPQRELLHETGRTAFQHFCTPLWGAIGRDALGQEVELGMIAGALVNQEDIAHSLFTPDVTWPRHQALSAEEYIFFSRLPQALSTEAEMMMRYHLQKPRAVLQRVHVTGGTNGILIDALRRQRSFTPSVIGRAEDQAYLLSALFSRKPYLRYLHQDGLIMRHDKNLFAEEAIRKAQTGKIIGDYVRILLFSEYARSLPWPVDSIKEQIDPFTGCFVSSIPRTVIMLRFGLKYFDLFNAGKKEAAGELFRLGVYRLGKLFEDFPLQHNNFKTIYEEERQAWDCFYDILQMAEEGLAASDPFVNTMGQKIRQIIAESVID